MQPRAWAADNFASPWAEKSRSPPSRFFCNGAAERSDTSTQRRNLAPAPSQRYLSTPKANFRHIPNRCGVPGLVLCRTPDRRKRAGSRGMSEQAVQRAVCRHLHHRGARGLLSNCVVDNTKGLKRETPSQAFAKGSAKGRLPKADAKKLRKRTSNRARSRASSRSLPCIPCARKADGPSLASTSSVVADAGRNDTTTAEWPVALDRPARTILEMKLPGLIGTVRRARLRGWVES